jgi:hypothetical protein
VKISEGMELLRTILREEGDLELELPNGSPLTKFTVLDEKSTPVWTHRQRPDRPGWSSRKDLNTR